MITTMVYGTVNEGVYFSHNMPTPVEQLREVLPHLSEAAARKILERKDIDHNLEKAIEWGLMTAAQSLPKQIAVAKYSPLSQTTASRVPTQGSRGKVLVGQGTKGPDLQSLLPSELPGKLPAPYLPGLATPIRLGPSVESRQASKAPEADQLPPLDLRGGHRVWPNDEEGKWVYAVAEPLLWQRDGQASDQQDNLVPCLPVVATGPASKPKPPFRDHSRPFWPDGQRWCESRGKSDLILLPGASGQGSKIDKQADDFSFPTPIPIGPDSVEPHPFTGVGNKRQKAYRDVGMLPDQLQQLLKPVASLPAGSQSPGAGAATKSSSSSVSSSRSSRSGVSSRGAAMAFPASLLPSPSPSTSGSSRSTGLPDRAAQREACDFMQGMFAQTDPSTVGDVLHSVGFNVDMAIDKLLALLAASERQPLPSLPSDTEGSESAASSVSGISHGISSNARDDDPAADYSFKGLTIEQKVRILRRFHPDIPSSSLMDMLVDNGGDLDTVAAILVTNTDMAALQRLEEQEAHDKALAQHIIKVDELVEGDEALAKKLQEQLAVEDPSAQAGKAGLEEQWLTVDTRTQARIAALQRCFPSASPDAVSSALAACGNDLQAAKQVLRDAGLQAAESVVRTAAPSPVLSPSSSADAAADRFDFPLHPRSRPFQPARPPSRHNATYAANKVLYDEHRKLEQRLYEAKKNALHESWKTFYQGDRKGAALLRDQAYSFDQQAREAHEMAGRNIAAAKNSSQAMTIFLDLHGLHVDEALREADKRIHIAEQYVHQCFCPAVIRIITGKGLHSPDSIPRILPAIKAMLTLRKLKFEEQPGQILVRFRHPDSANAVGNIVV